MTWRGMAPTAEREPALALRIYITYTQKVSSSSGDSDDDFLALLDAYLDEPHDPNPALAEVCIVWIEDDPGLGAFHIARHNVSKAEVEQVLFEIPPIVEAKRSRHHSERTFFWGATRHDRWLFVVCEDWIEDEVRYLKPITAFEPDHGEAYWRSR
jgi:uncharacterized DUF497 family protein